MGSLAPRRDGGPMTETPPPQNPSDETPESEGGAETGGGAEPAGGAETGGEPRRLTRSGGDAIIGGVASGLGRYFGVDPVLFRIGFVVATFIGAVGIIAYLALLVFVPSDGEQKTSGTSKALAVAGAV